MSPGERARAFTRLPMRAHGAFSLLELLVVLLILGLVAGIAAPRLVRAGVREAERKQMADLVGLLASERVEAMRAVAPVSVKISVRDAKATADGRAGRLAWSDWRTTMLGEGALAAPAANVEFDAAGLTRTRELGFVARDGSGRIWTVVFDPISGAPGLRSAKEHEGS